MIKVHRIYTKSLNRYICHICDILQLWEYGCYTIFKKAFFKPPSFCWEGNDQQKIGKQNDNYQSTVVRYCHSDGWNIEREFSPRSVKYDPECLCVNGVYKKILRCASISSILYVKIWSEHIFEACGLVFRWKITFKFITSLEYRAQNKICAISTIIFFM